MRLAMLALAMADPTSTPLPAYMTPFGETPEPRIYLVERLTPEEMHELDEAAQTPPPEDDEPLDLAHAANDSVWTSSSSSGAHTCRAECCGPRAIS